MSPGNIHRTADCAPARDVLSRVGDSWSMLIIILLGDGPQRFNELRRTIDGISQRMLSLTLKNLERDGFVLRTVTPTVPPRVDYSLTELGFSVWHPVKQLGQWAISHHSEIEASRQSFDARRAASMPEAAAPQRGHRSGSHS